MKKRDGITLLSLAITITVILILISCAVYNGINAIKLSKLTAFTAKMKIMQSNVNSMYDKYKNGEKITIDGKTYEISNIESDTTNEIQAKKNEIFDRLKNDANSGIYIEAKDQYKYWDSQLISKLGLEDVGTSFFVNVQKRSIISYKEIEYEGKLYYTLAQLPDSVYNVEYNNPNHE